MASMLHSARCNSTLARHTNANAHTHKEEYSHGAMQNPCLNNPIHASLLHRPPTAPPVTEMYNPRCQLRQTTYTSLTRQHTRQQQASKAARMEAFFNSTLY